MRMKKMLILALIALFYIGISAMVPPQKVVVDKDVGIIYVSPSIQATDVIINETNYTMTNNLITYMPESRSIVSGVEKSDLIVYSNEETFECNIYYTIDRIDLKLPTLTGFENQPDKYPFASDLGLRKS
jgi:hypothetical protein